MGPVRDMTETLWRIALVLGLLAGLFALTTLEPVRAEPPVYSGKVKQARAWPGPFRVQVLEATDGDTVFVRFREGPCGRGPCDGQELALRLSGIDTPEKKLCGAKKSQSCAACPEEVELGKQATEFIQSFARPGVAARARSLKPDPYSGRIVGRLEVLKDGAWQDASKLMIQEGLAVRYDPERSGSFRKLKSWCPR